MLASLQHSPWIECPALHLFQYHHPNILVSIHLPWKPASLTSSCSNTAGSCTLFCLLLGLALAHMLYVLQQETIMWPIFSRSTHGSCHTLKHALQDSKISLHILSIQFFLSIKALSSSLSGVFFIGQSTLQNFGTHLSKNAPKWGWNTFGITHLE